jgi:hypothetical protein
VPEASAREIVKNFLAGCFSKTSQSNPNTARCGRSGRNCRFLLLRTARKNYLLDTFEFAQTSGVELCDFSCALPVPAMSRHAASILPSIATPK